MRRDNVFVVSDKLSLATADQIRAAEHALGTRFPAGYREYVTTLGAGSLNGRARVVPPSEIVDQTIEFRDRMHFLYRDATAGYDPFELFKTGLDLLPPARLLQCILVIDAGDGHEIIYHPDTPDALFLLPHDQEGIYRVGSTIEEALTAFLSNDRYIHAMEVLSTTGQFEDRLQGYFEPDRSAERVYVELDPAVSYQEFRTSLIEMALEQPSGALMVRDYYFTDENDERESLLLFVREYGGIVGTGDGSAPGRGVSVHVRFDGDHRTERLESMLSVLCNRACTVTYNDDTETLA
jgi:hypothetical protein